MPRLNKINTHLDHISRCKTASGTTWSNRWTYRLYHEYSRRLDSAGPGESFLATRSLQGPGPGWADFYEGGTSFCLILPFSIRKKRQSSEKEVWCFTISYSSFLDFSSRNGPSVNKCETCSIAYVLLEKRLSSSILPDFLLHQTWSYSRKI